MPRWERGERSREGVGRRSEPPARAPRSGKLVGDEEGGALRVVTERGPETIRVQRGVLPLKGKEGSWRTAKISMGKSAAGARGAEGKRNGGVPTLFRTGQECSSEKIS